MSGADKSAFMSGHDKERNGCALKKNKSALIFGVNPKVPKRTTSALSLEGMPKASFTLRVNPSSIKGGCAVGVRGIICES